MVWNLMQGTVENFDPAERSEVGTGVRTARSRLKIHHTLGHYSRERQDPREEGETSPYRFPPVRFFCAVSRFLQVIGHDVHTGYLRSAEVLDDRLSSSLILHTHVRLQFRDLVVIVVGLGW